MATTSTKYFVSEGKSVSSKKGILGPHTEVRVKDINPTDEGKGKESLKILIKKGFVYEADKPLENAAEKAKALQNDSLREAADLKFEVKNLNAEKVALVSNLDSCKTNLGEAKEEISKLEDKLKKGANNEALDAEKTAHSETQASLDKTEEALGEEMTAHEATKKALEESEKNLSEATITPAAGDDKPGGAKKK